jgi:hypothetical protein
MRAPCSTCRAGARGIDRYLIHCTAMSTDTRHKGSTPTEHVLANYFRAKDGNRPHLLERVFCADAKLEIKNASSAIAFPAITHGRESIADVLVGDFGRDNENVYSFYLSRPPSEPVEQFSCTWLVGMTEKFSKSVRVGCGTYHWTLKYQPSPLAAALAISIDVMQVLAPTEVNPVMAWLEGLTYPWTSAASAASSAPGIEGLKPVIDYLRQYSASLDGPASSGAAL